LAEILYKLRYKHGLSHVQDGLIKITDTGTPEGNQGRAEAVARAYCGTIPGMRYVGVVPAILADDSILPEVRQAQTPKTLTEASAQGGQSTGNKKSVSTAA
jgi:hypothetical protein